MSAMTFEEANAHLEEIESIIENTHEPVEVTRNGVTTLVVMSAEQYERIKLIHEILSDDETMAALEENKRNPGQGISLKQMQAELRASGRIK